MRIYNFEIPKIFSSISSSISLTMLLTFVVLSFLSSSVFALDDDFNKPAKSPTGALPEWSSSILPLIAITIVTMIFLAAVVYAIGRVFGSDIQARATVWSHNMLAAAGLSGIIIVLLYMFSPTLTSGTINTFDIRDILKLLQDTTQSALFVLIFFLLVLSALAYAIAQIAGTETRATATNWANGLLAAAFFAAIFYVIFYQLLSQNIPDFIQTNPYLGVYSEVVLRVIFFMGLIGLVTYLLSKVFKVQEWEAYLNVEFSQIMNSILLLIFMTGFFAAGSAIALSFTGGGATSPPQAAIAYLQSSVADSTLKATLDMYKIQACTSILSTFSRRIGEFVLTMTYKVFPGIDTFVSITNVLTSTLIMVFGSLSVQANLLYFIDATMLSLFLPAGLILRFFPATRDAGAFLIAVAFGFQVVFPTSYLINKQILSDIGFKEPYYSSPTVLILNLCGPLKYASAGFLFNTSPVGFPLYNAVPGLKTTGDILARIFSEGFLNAISMVEFIPIMRDVASISLVAFFIPAFSTMITIAFINSMTKFIVAKV